MSTDNPPPPPEQRGPTPPAPGDPVAPPPPTSGALHETAGLWKRFGARVIDALVIGIPLGIILTVAGVPAFLSGVINGLVGLGYFVALESSRGATIGKQMLSLEVARADGGPVDMDTALRRNWWLGLGIFSGIPFIGWVFSLLSLAIVILIAVTISSDPENRGWHDKLAGSLVLDH